MLSGFHTRLAAGPKPVPYIQVGDQKSDMRLFQQP